MPEYVPVSDVAETRQGVIGHVASVRGGLYTPPRPSTGNGTLIRPACRSSYDRTGGVPRFEQRRVDQQTHAQA